jgi:ABC-type phosphate/phosphonate transport system substrate-binding protein
MRSEQIAGLPMYDYPELAATHDAWWTAVSSRLAAAGIPDVPRKLTRSLGHFDIWTHARLLLGQGCEYPLATRFAGAVRLVATPRYSVPGCESESHYRSAIVVRADDPAETLADLRQRRCAINEGDSNSGMNLLRAAIAALAGGQRFFESVAVSGSHRGSAAMVAAGKADVTALDCVSFAHFQRLDPSIVTQLRVLGWTPPTPSPPFITARATDATTFQVLRSVLASAMADPALAATNAALFLTGFDFEPDSSLDKVLSHERQAAALGYPTLV